MRLQEFTLLKETTLGGFPVKVLKIQDQGVEEAGNANSGRRGSNHYSPPDSSPVKLGRVEKTATGIRHHARPENYGGYQPEPELKGLNKTLTKNLDMTLSPKMIIYWGHSSDGN